MEWYWIALIIFGWSASGITCLIITFREEKGISLECLIGCIVGGAVLGTLIWVMYGLFALLEPIDWKRIIIKKK